MSKETPIYDGEFVDDTSEVSGKTWIVRPGEHAGHRMTVLGRIVRDDGTQITLAVVACSCGDQFRMADGTIARSVAREEALAEKPPRFAVEDWQEDENGGNLEYLSIVERTEYGDGSGTTVAWEEYATITHRFTDHPEAAQWRLDKERRAAVIVAALNAFPEAEVERAWKGAAS